MSCGVGHRDGSDLVLLWLWHRLAAVAQIRPLAWEPPYAMSANLKRQEKEEKKKKMGWKKIFIANENDKKVGVTILISDKIDFKPKKDSI